MGSFCECSLAGLRPCLFTVRLQRSLTALSKKPTKKIILSFFEQYLLCPHKLHEGAIPSGLSQDSLKLIGKLPSFEVLGKEKKAIINYAEAAEGYIPDCDRFILAIIGLQDSHADVASHADYLLKAIKDLDREDPVIVKRLYALYLGSDTRKPASLALKMVVLRQLTRSMRSANEFPAVLKVIFDAILATDTNRSLQVLGLEFVNWVLTYAADAVMKPMAPVLLSGLLKLRGQEDLNDGSRASQSLRGSIYCRIGTVVSRCPDVILRGGKVDVSLAEDLFKAATLSADPDLKVSVLEGLSLMRRAYAEVVHRVSREASGSKGDTGEALPSVMVVDGGEALFQLLRTCVEKGLADDKQSGAAATALDWSNTIYPFQDANARALCLLGLSSSRNEIREVALRGILPEEYAQYYLLATVTFSGPEEPKGPASSTTKESKVSGSGSGKGHDDTRSAKEGKKDAGKDKGASDAAPRAESSSAKSPKVKHADSPRSRKPAGNAPQKIAIPGPPPFGAMVAAVCRLIVGQAHPGDDVSYADLETFLPKIQAIAKESLSRSVLPLSQETYSQVILFLERCLAATCRHWGEKRLPAGSTDRTVLVSDSLAEMLKTDEPECTEVAIGIMILGELAELSSRMGSAPAHLQAISLASLIKCLAVRRDLVVSLVGRPDGIKWVMKLLVGGGTDTVRENAGRLLALTALGMEKSELEGLLQSLFKTIRNPSAEVEERHGSLISAGLLLGAIRRERAEEVECSCSLTLELIAAACPLMKNKSSAGDVTLAVVASRAVGALGHAGPLPLPCGTTPQLLKALEGDKQDSKEETEDENAAKRMKMEESEEEWTVSRVINSLATLLKSRVPRVCDAAALALGHIALGVGRSERPSDTPSATIVRRWCMQSLCSLSVTQGEDSHLTIGEALLCCLSGKLWRRCCPPASTAAPETLSFDEWGDVAKAREEEGQQHGERGDGDAVMEEESLFDEFVTSLLDEFLISADHGRRGAACTWTLLLLKFAGHLPSIRSRVGALQAKLIGLLHDPDDFTQQTAGKALAVLFQRCDELRRKEMVAQLTAAFEKGKSKKTFEGDGSLFAPGSLRDGKSGSGSGSGSGAAGKEKGLSTYKELSQMANDLGKPELVYKFIEIANHNAVWNGRKGAALGLASIASVAPELNEHMEKTNRALIPKLFRYLYDPNTRVQTAMQDLWNSMVPNTSQALDENFDAVMKELLSGVVNRQWRLREGSCYALADLLEGRRYDQVGKYLPQLWEHTFRALDDIKETVRKAATQVCRRLASLSERLCDPTQTLRKDATSALGAVLPALFEKGFANESKDVQKLCVKLVSGVIKGAGAIIRPHVADTVITLLQNLSTQEAQVLNYIQFHVGAEGRDALDSARISATHEHTLTDCIDLCLRHADETVLEDLVPRLASLTRRGVGLPTRSGCARAIVLLCMLHSQSTAVKSGANKLANACLAACKTEHTDAMRAAFSDALANVVRVAGDDCAEKILRKCQILYRGDIENTDVDAVQADETSQSVACAVMRSLTRQAADQIAHTQAIALPFLFIARHESEEKNKKAWQEIWNDAASSGTSAAVRLFLDEILDECLLVLRGVSFPLKQQACKSLHEVGVIARSSVAPRSPQVLLAVFDTLKNRNWDGKDSALDAIATIACESIQELVIADQQPPTTTADAAETTTPSTVSLSELLQNLIRESQRSKRSYRLASIEALTRVIKAAHPKASSVCVSILPNLIARAEENLKLPEKGENDEIDEKDVTQAEKTREERERCQLIGACLVAVAEAWPEEINDANSTEIQDTHVSSVVPLLRLSLSRAAASVPLRRSLGECAERLAERTAQGGMARVCSKENPEKLGDVLVDVIEMCLADEKFAEVRLAGVRAIPPFASRHLSSSPAGASACEWETTKQQVCARLNKTLRAMLESETAPAVKTMVPKAIGAVAAACP
eukprot:Rmarinus@m.5492